MVFCIGEGGVGGGGGGNGVGGVGGAAVRTARAVTSTIFAATLVHVKQWTV